MGLCWTERTVARNWDGKDVHGKPWAQVIGHAGSYDALVNERGCGVRRGMSLGCFSTPEDAMLAADRHVVAYVDGLGSGAVELRHGDTPP